MVYIRFGENERYLNYTNQDRSGVETKDKQPLRSIEIRSCMNKNNNPGSLRMTTNVHVLKSRGPDFEK